VKRLQIELPADLHRAAKVKAAQTGLSMAEVCRRALAAWIQRALPHCVHCGTELPLKMTVPWGPCQPCPQCSQHGFAFPQEQEDCYE